MTQSQFIQRLKQQPRIGNILEFSASDWGDLGTAAQGALEGIFKSVKALDDVSTTTVIGLEKQFAVNEQLAKITRERLSGALMLERRNASLNKSLGITTKEAAKISMEIANFSKHLSISQLSIIKMQGTFKKLATTIDLTANGNRRSRQELTASQTLLTRNLKLSEEQAEKFQYYASMTKKVNGQEVGFMTNRLETTIKVAAAIEKTTGMSGALKTITEEISMASAATQMQFGRMPGTLEMAAIKAKSLGFSLDEMASSGKQMLDIESSIGNELEYQLLSGRRLTDDNGKSLTNMYREATLRGDMNAQADVMNKILEDEGETLENNLFAREQMSKLLGIDEAKLARALQKKKILEATGDAGRKLMGLEGDDLIKKARKEVQAGRMAASDLDKLIANQKDTRTTDEKLDEQIVIANETYAATILGTQQSEMIKDSSAKLVELTAESMGVKLKPGPLAGVGQGAAGTDAFLKIFTDVKSLLGAKTNFDITQKKDDFKMSPVGMPGYQRVLSGPAGSFAINDNDTITGQTKSSDGGGGMDPNAFATAIVRAVRDYGKFEISGDPVATAFAT